MRPRLATPRLVLRAPVPEDIDELAALLSDPDVTWYPYRRGRTRDEVEAMLEQQLAVWGARQPGRWLALDHSHSVLGVVGFRECPWAQLGTALDIGWRFARAVWGRGLATEAAVAVLDQAFSADTFDVVSATFQPENVRMAALASRLGFREVATNREFGHEVIVTKLVRSQWSVTASRLSP